jgi:hypothetical protein
MKKLIDYLNSYESHDWAEYATSCKALADAKFILIGTEGSVEEREQLYEAVVHHQWVEGQRSASEGI